MKQHQWEAYESISLPAIQHIMTDMMKDLHAFLEENEIPYCLAYGSLLGAIRHDGFIPWDDDMDIFMMRKDYLRFEALAKTKLPKRFFLQTPLSDRHFRLLHVPYKVRDQHSTLLEEPDRFYHQGAFIDIFVLDDVVDEYNLNRALKRCSMLSSLKMRIDASQLKGVKKYLRIALQLLFKPIPAAWIYRYNRKRADRLKKDEKSAYVQVGIEHMERLRMRRSDLFPLQLHTFEDTQFYVPHHSDTILKQIYGDYMQLPDPKDRVPHAKFYLDKAVFEWKS